MKNFFDERLPLLIAVGCVIGIVVLCVFHITEVFHG